MHLHTRYLWSWVIIINFKNPECINTVSLSLAGFITTKLKCKTYFPIKTCISWQQNCRKDQINKIFLDYSLRKIVASISVSLIFTMMSTASWAKRVFGIPSSQTFEMTPMGTTLAPCKEPFDNFTTYAT